MRPHNDQELTLLQAYNIAILRSLSYREKLLAYVSIANCIITGFPVLVYLLLVVSGVDLCLSLEFFDRFLRKSQIIKVSCRQCIIATFIVPVHLSDVTKSQPHKLLRIMLKCRYKS